MPTLNEDANGHRTLGVGPALAAGAVSTTVAGTIVPTTAAGATPTVTLVAANDDHGRYVLSPVTGGGAQAAGATSHVFFSTLYRAAPRAVIVNISDNAGPVWVGAVATTITAAGFDVSTPILTTAHTYTVDYVVLP
jgi:hypothetical protein